MKLGCFSVTIPEGTGHDGGYVEMLHGSKYTIVLENDSYDRCDAEITIDGKWVGMWRVLPWTKATLDRPVDDTGCFTFYRLGTPQGDKAEVFGTDFIGLVSVIFKPEAPKPLPDAAASRSFTGIQSAPVKRTFIDGGTGLSGESKQRFTDVEQIKHDESRGVTINLRLVCSHEEPEAMPSVPQVSPVPPRVGEQLAPEKLEPVVASDGKSKLSHLHVAVGSCVITALAVTGYFMATRPAPPSYFGAPMTQLTPDPSLPHSLSKTGIRHNSTCRYYDAAKACIIFDGRACKICGG